MLELLLIAFGLLLLAGFVLALLLPALVALLIWLLPLLHFLFAAFAVFSCMKSNKPMNTKLLWIIIILLAPFIGSLLWFFWGKKNA